MRGFSSGVDGKPAAKRKKDHSITKLLHRMHRLSLLSKREKNRSISILMRKISLRSQRDADAVQIKFRRSDFKGVCSCCPETYIGEFCPRCLENMKLTFQSSLYETFSRYYCRKLSIEKIVLEMFEIDSNLVLLLEKWIPILIVPDMLLKTFSLCFSRPSSVYYGLSSYFDLPSVVFQVKSLEKLCLERCSVNQFTGMVRLVCLQTLSLKSVFIQVETLEMLLSSCPFIENVVLKKCKGLTAPKEIRIKHNNLKHFSFSAYLEDSDDDNPSIEIDAPNVISLSMKDVQLHTNNFKNLSSHFPPLEDFSVLFCKGQGGLKLSSRCSIKRLSLAVERDSIKATIDAPNLRDFKFTGEFAQTSLAFAPTSSEWKSHVELEFLEDLFDDDDEDFFDDDDEDFFDDDDDELPWFHNLGELLSAFSISQISLDVGFENLKPNQQKEGGFNHHDPFAVENLRLRLLYDYAKSSPSLPHFLNGLFSVCRPRYTQTLNNDNQLFDFLCQVLVQEREKRDYFWQKDLEEVNMEVWDKETNEWDPTTLPDCELPSKQDIRFRLKWSDKEASKQACLLLGSLSLHTFT